MAFERPPTPNSSSLTSTLKRLARLCRSKCKATSTHRPPGARPANRPKYQAASTAAVPSDGAE
eukprot:8937657-Alexandrium_andersonii.AAC.1